MTIWNLGIFRTPNNPQLGVRYVTLIQEVLKLLDHVTTVHLQAGVVQLHGECNVNCGFQTTKLGIRYDFQVDSSPVITTNTTFTHTYRRLRYWWIRSQYYETADIWRGSCSPGARFSKNLRKNPKCSISFSWLYVKFIENYKVKIFTEL